MYGGAEPTELAGTAFRHAEKKYKLHRDQILRRSRGKLRGGKLVTREVDLSSVIDFSAAATANQPSPSDASDALLDTRVVRLSCPSTARPIFTLEGRDGFYFIPGALTVTEQRDLVAAALVDFPNAPNRTNHDAELGQLDGLWEAAKAGLFLAEGGNSPVQGGNSPAQGGN
eukprot:1010157-Prorocentrum_minimum.AAC.1